MRGADIPLQTIYTITKNGTKSHKEPLYKLQTTEEVKARQDKLGENAGWYFGTLCKKCCGVYPAFFNDLGFEHLGYYVCLVCGKESLHNPMPWQSRDDWNAGRYKWKPDGLYEQMDIFSFLKEEQCGSD